LPSAVVGVGAAGALLVAAAGWSAAHALGLLILGVLIAVAAILH
jgi:hypothetical protein